MFDRWVVVGAMLIGLGRGHDATAKNALVGPVAPLGLPQHPAAVTEIEIEITFRPPVRCNATQRTGGPLRGRSQCFIPAQPPQPDPCASGDEGASLALACPHGGVVTKVAFALYGDVKGSCSSGALSKGSCGTDISPAVTAACVGQSGCTVHCSHKDKGCAGGDGPTCGCAITAASGKTTFLKLPDPCPGRPKTQGVTMTCNNTAPAPPKAPTPSCVMTAVVGCFQWPRLDYHAGFFPTFKGNNSHFTQETCADACCGAGYGTDAVSAVSLHPKLPGGSWAWMGADCYCATAKAFDAVFAGAAARRNTSECNMECPGNKSQSCGGAPLAGPDQKLLVSRASCRNCAAAPAPATDPAVAGVRPAVPGAQNVFVRAGVCCLWNGKCRAHCNPSCHVHDVPNSVNSTRTVVYRNWSTRVSTAIIADANDFPQAPEGPNENAVALLSDNKTVFTVMRLGGGDYGHYYTDYLQSRSVSQHGNIVVEQLIRVH